MSGYHIVEFSYKQFLSLLFITILSLTTGCKEESGSSGGAENGKSDAANRAPLSATHAFMALEDTTSTHNLIASDPDGNSITFALVSSPTNGVISLNTSTGSFQYSPNVNFNGIDTFSFKVSDGVLETSAFSVSINVQPAVDNITVQNGNLTVNEDVTGTLEMSVVNIDSLPATYSIVSNGSKGVASFSGSTLTYVPTLNQFGSDVVTVRAQSVAGYSNTATIYIVINPVNDRPVANNISAAADFAAPVKVTLTGQDVENDVLTFQVASLPLHGSLQPVYGDPKSYYYTPNAGFLGNDSFTYTASDMTLVSVPATVNVVVTKGAPGTVDVRYGASGLSLSTFVASLSMALPDGKVVAIGYGANYNLRFYRFNVDGSPDTTLHPSGYKDQIISSDWYTVPVHKGLAYSNGKIIVAGTRGRLNTLVRLDQNGDLDSSFGNGGIVDISSEFVFVDYLTDLKILVTPSDKLIVVGFKNSITATAQIRMAQYSNSGVLENVQNITFSDIAYWAEDLNVYRLAVTDVLMQPDGKPVLAGYVVTYTAPDYVSVPFFIRRLASGGPDTSFSGDGLYLDGSGRGSSWMNITYDNGKIYAAGEANSRRVNNVGYTGGTRFMRFSSLGSLEADINLSSTVRNGEIIPDGNGKFLVLMGGSVWKISATGSKDLSFGTNGVYTYPSAFPNFFSASRLWLQLSNSRILTTGATYSSAFAMHRLWN